MWYYGGYKANPTGSGVFPVHFAEFASYPNPYIYRNAGCKGKSSFAGSCTSPLLMAMYGLLKL